MMTPVPQHSVSPLVSSLYSIVISSGSQQLSVAVAHPVLSGCVDSSHSIVTLTGQVIVGFVVSSIFTTALSVPVLPASSVPAQVTSTPIPDAHSRSKLAKAGPALTISTEES